MVTISAYLLSFIRKTQEPPLDSMHTWLLAQIHLLLAVVAVLVFLFSCAIINHVFINLSQVWLAKSPQYGMESYSVLAVWVLPWGACMCLCGCLCMWMAGQESNHILHEQSWKWGEGYRVEQREWIAGYRRLTHLNSRLSFTIHSLFH